MPEPVVVVPVVVVSVVVVSDAVVGVLVAPPLPVLFPGVPLLFAIAVEIVPGVVVARGLLGRKPETAGLGGHRRTGYGQRRGEHQT